MHSVALLRHVFMRSFGLFFNRRGGVIQLHHEYLALERQPLHFHAGTWERWVFFFLKRLSFTRLLLSALLALVITQPVFAAGFSLTEYSVKGMGSAYAGSTSGLDEAATLFWNPAGMTRLSGTRIALGAVLVDFSSKFRDRGSSRRLSTPVGAVELPSNGGSGDAGGTFVTPNAYLTSAINDRLVLGIGVHAPFGLETRYDKDWIGRYHAIKSSIKTIDINPSMAWRLNESWSIGAGVSAQYVDAELTNAVFTGGPDGLVKLRADDWSFGFNLGLLFEPGEGTRIGLSWRSAIDHRLKGDRRLSGLGSAIDGKVGAATSVKLPANIAFGIRHALTDKLSLMGDVTWTGWSSFDELRVSFDDNSADAVTSTSWNDNFRLSLGLAWEALPAWTFRGGAMYDQSPVPGKEERTAAIPDADRYWLAAGASWRVTPDIAIDIAYAHLFFTGADIERTIDLVPQAPGAFQDTLRGRFDNAVDGLAVELRYRF